MAQQPTPMTAVYAFNLNTLEHSIICNGTGAKFSVDGKYINANASMTGAMPVDIVSVLQQGTLAEVALVCNQQYYKTPIDLEYAKQWINEIPVSTKFVANIKRTVNGGKTLQTLYVYPQGKIAPYVANLLKVGN